MVKVPPAEKISPKLLSAHKSFIEEKGRSEKSTDFELYIRSIDYKK